MIKKYAEEPLTLIALVILGLALILKSVVVALAIWGLLILRDEVIRPILTKRPDEIKDLTEKVDNIQLEINAIKIEKAVRR